MSKPLAELIDADVEALMKEAKDAGRTYTAETYENEIRKRQTSRTLPFDARNEVSADARYVAGRIVTHMWIIGVALPVVLGTLFAVLTAK